MFLMENFEGNELALLKINVKIIWRTKKPKDEEAYPRAEQIKKLLTTAAKWDRC